jgi:hypothetical protein
MATLDNVEELALIAQEMGVEVIEVMRSRVQCSERTRAHRWRR